MQIIAIELLLLPAGGRGFGVAVHEVQVEVVMLSVLDGAGLGWPVASGNLPAGCHPDARAQEPAGLGARIPTRDGRALDLVATRGWWADPDLRGGAGPRPGPGRGPAGPGRCGRGLLDGCRGADSCGGNGGGRAGHALRHLSLVTRTSPAVVEAADVYPLLWRAVVAHSPDVPGQLVTS
ncbi:MAG TPA: hypothetical protein VJ757_06480 [Pseudonocardiaceae bacterium]|nr:hypothetical protein [Pseudonocardiaceae bacterium]